MRNLIPNYFESYFIVVFSTEAIMKIISLGFVIKKGSYLRDPWNWLDFLVVLCSFISIIPGIDNYTFLRTFRLFRPLRNFRSIPYMKTLIGTVISSMFGLSEILVFVGLIFYIYSILGVSIWAGDIEYRWRTIPQPAFGDWPVIESDTRLWQSRICPVGYCGSLVYEYDHNPGSIDLAVVGE